MCTGCQGRLSKTGQGQGMVKVAEWPWGDGRTHWRDGDREEVGNFWPEFVSLLAC